MRVSLVILAILLFEDFARSLDADRKPLDEDSLRGYMAGKYDLIGRKPDSTATYSGSVTLRDENGVLQGIRTIESKTDECVALKSRIRFESFVSAGTLPSRRHMIAPRCRQQIVNRSRRIARGNEPKGREAFELPV